MSEPVQSCSADSVELPSFARLRSSHALQLTNIWATPTRQTIRATRCFMRVDAFSPLSSQMLPKDLC